MKKTILVVALAMAALVPLVGVEWTPPATTGAPLVSAEASTPDPTPTCLSEQAGLPRLGLFNASEAIAAGFPCGWCFSHFDACMAACAFEPDTPGEVVCQNNCMNALADCVGTCVP